MMLVLKLPVVYLCAVVWYAIKAEPETAAGESGSAGDRAPTPWSPWRRWGGTDERRPRRGGPHGSPDRGYARAPQPAGARAEGQRR